MVRVIHRKVTSAAADLTALVDGPAWDDDHIVTGLENVPNVDTTNASNLTSGTLPAGRLPAPTAGTLGGVMSLANASNKWLNSIGTDGLPTQTQPAFGNISGNIAVSQMNSGTSASGTTFWRGDGAWGVPGISGSAVSGASTTYTSAQAGVNVERSNSGAAMADTLPGTSPGVLPANSVVTVSNADASALLAISAGSGALIKGSTVNGFLYLGPGQAVQIQSDGSNYWVVAAPVRARLGAATTFFAASTGSASNHGLTVASPLDSGTNAYIRVQKIVDANGFAVTIQVADATYTSPIVMDGPIVGQQGTFVQGSVFPVILQGNLVTPANVLISVTGNSFGAIQAINGADVLVQGFKVTTSGAGNGIYVEHASLAFKTMDFGACFVNHVGAARQAYVQTAGAYTISGSAQAHWLQSNSWISCESTATITLTGTPAWSAAFAVSQYTGVIVLDAQPTFSGSATGLSHSAFMNGVINTGGHGLNFFPGNVNGTTATGGQYN